MNIERSVQDGFRFGKMFADALGVLSRPFSLTTQVFLKKGMGERFFGPWHGVLAAGLIVLAAYASLPGNSAFSFRLSEFIGGTAVQPPSKQMAYAVGGAWLAGFGIAAFVHRAQIRRRYHKGERWHSRCSGDAIASWMQPWMRYVITGGIGLVLYKLKLEPLAALAWISLFFTIMSDELERMAFYNAVLDAIDGQLESEYLAKAVEDRLSPSKAAGVMTPLPSYVADAYRPKVAEAIRSQSRVKVAVADSEVEAKPNVNAPTALPGT